MTEKAAEKDMLSCDNGKPLSAVFARAHGDAHKTPFKFDIAALTSVQNILNDPSVKKALDTDAQIVIASDHVMKEILADPMEKFTTLGKDTPERDITPQHLDMIVARLERFNPALKDHFLFGMKLLSDELRQAYPQQSPEDIKAGAARMMIDILASDQSSHEFTAFSDGDLNQEELYLVRIPHEQDGRGVKITFEGSDNQALKPPPGTPAQIAALTIIHELEHAADQGQKNIDDYFLKANDAMIKEECRLGGVSSIHDNMINAREQESAMAEVHALKSVVPEALLRHDAAAYMANEFDIMIHGAGIREALDPAHTHAANGYAMMEYLETGQPRDYWDLTATVNGFYAKTLHSFADQVQTAKAAQNLETQTAIPDLKPQLAVTLDLIKKNLAQENSPYTPAQAHIARQFVSAMENDLGVKAQDIGAYLEKSISDYKSQMFPAEQTPLSAPLQTNPAAKP